LQLRHSGDLYFKSHGRPLQLGRITYTCSIDARSMFIDVDISLEIASGVQVSDVVLTIGHGPPGGINHRTVDADIGPARPLFSAGMPGWQRREIEGASYYLIRHRHISGDSWGIHSISRDLARLSAPEAVIQHWGRFRRVVACYLFPGAQCGTRRVARERKLITAGGFYDRIEDYGWLMRGIGLSLSSQQDAWDLSTSYNYGSAVNAFAKCFAVPNAIISREVPVGSKAFGPSRRPSPQMVSGFRDGGAQTRSDVPVYPLENGPIFDG
jgi:hypothetical protein